MQEEGIESALATLYRKGVYLTVDEFKGRTAVKRGTGEVAVQPGLLRNPATRFHLLSQTSGSGGQRTQVPIDLRHLGDRVVNLVLFLEAAGLRRSMTALWSAPGGASIVNSILFAAAGVPPVKWFSQVDPESAEVHPRYRWSARALRWSGSVAGVRLATPEYAPVDRPATVTRWITDSLAAGKTPHLYTYVSAAVRLCEAAARDGTSLEGARLTVTGEPITEAKVAVLERAGALVSTNYGSNECGGFIGYGCLAREAPDEVHLFHDLHALIQAGHAGPESPLVPENALLITSLLPSAPLLLLNVSLGDQAVFSSRDCGCALHAFGFNSKLHTIRSFEKLTVGGAAFIDTDVVDLLEALLPSRFGGGPSDYQLEERAMAATGPRLRLLVSPAVGPVDEDEVADVFLRSLGEASPSARIAVQAWREAQMLAVERREPERTASGKVLHVRRA